MLPRESFEELHLYIMQIVHTLSQNPFGPRHAKYPDRLLFSHTHGVLIALLTSHLPLPIHSDGIFFRGNI